MPLMMGAMYGDLLFSLWSVFLHVSYASLASFSSICISIA
jgi:hypothetical protein